MRKSLQRNRMTCGGNKFTGIRPHEVAARPECTTGALS